VPSFGLKAFEHRMETKPGYCGLPYLDDVGHVVGMHFLGEDYRNKGLIFDDGIESWLAEIGHAKKGEQIAQFFRAPGVSQAVGGRTA